MQRHHSPPGKSPGHFLYASSSRGEGSASVESPVFHESSSSCLLTFQVCGLNGGEEGGAWQQIFSKYKITQLYQKIFQKMFSKYKIIQLYLSGKPTFSLFPFIKNDASSPDGLQVLLISHSIRSTVKFFSSSNDFHQRNSQHCIITLWYSVNKFIPIFHSFIGKGWTDSTLIIHVV